EHPHLVLQLSDCAEHRGSAHDGAAARERADPERDAIGDAVDDVDRRLVDAELARGELCERRDDSLTDGGQSGVDDDAPGRGHLDAGVLPWPEARLPDEETDSDPETCAA